MTIFCRFLGLSQSLPVTSYVKMIDIWMLFTMMIPFLEVTLHTTNEVLIRSDCGRERQIGVVRVDPVQKLKEEERPGTSSSMNSSTLLKLSGRLILPIGSLIFTLTFWIVGLIKSYSSGYSQDPNMFGCLELDLS